MTQLEQALDQHLARLGQLSFCGIQTATAHHAAFALFNDAPPPLGTGSSFAIHPGETISQALGRVDQRYRAFSE